jgi:hypothetical protein
MEFRCIMATTERLEQGICQGNIPELRVRRGAVTCSPECFAEYRLQKRQVLAKYKCRWCGHRLRAKPDVEPSRSALQASDETIAPSNVQEIRKKVG